MNNIFNITSVMFYVHCFQHSQTHTPSSYNKFALSPGSSYGFSWLLGTLLPPDTFLQFPFTSASLPFTRLDLSEPLVSFMTSVLSVMDERAFTSRNWPTGTLRSEPALGVDPDRSQVVPLVLELPRQRLALEMDGCEAVMPLSLMTCMLPMLGRWVSRMVRL